MNQFKPVHLTLLALIFTVTAWAQGGPAVWRFGDVNGVVFTPGSPLPDSTHPNTYFYTNAGCATVTDRNGKLLFTANEYHVFDRNDKRLATFTGSTVNNFNSMISFTGTNATQSTLIVPFPRDTNRFYVFSLSSLGQLFYSVVDRSLNNGLGDIVPGKKGIVITAGLAEKMTAVKGCNNIWVVVRSRNSNRYFSYSITDTGLNLTPVVSNVGLLATGKYRGGVIKFAPDGRKMAAACFNVDGPTNAPYGGLELYDFDPFSGQLSNPLILDSSFTWYGACFSGDGSKLYASATDEKQVYQWDLSQPNTASLLASMTLVLTNPNYYRFSGGWLLKIPDLGDLQRGPDGKIYIGNNTTVQRKQVAPGVYSGYSHYLHVIHQPDQPGLLCMPQTDAVQVRYPTRVGLPNDVVSFPEQKDTVRRFQAVEGCFNESVQITADTGKEYIWDDGSSERTRIFTQPGIYAVRYTGTDCALHFDSFAVHFSKLPVAGADAFSCPGGHGGRLTVSPAGGDTTAYTYSWKDATGQVLKTSLSRNGDTITRLDTGRYFLQLTNAYGCDSVFSFYVQPLPLPEVDFTADSIVCVNKTFLLTSTGEGLAWNWKFGDGDSASTESTMHTYHKTGRYSVSLTTVNAEGCSHTKTKEITVKDFEVNLTVSESPVRKNTVVWLSTDASEPYRVLAWEPMELFEMQDKVRQQVVATESRYYTVVAESRYGCRDSATIEVRVHPLIFMPTAFSPNGDGKNDLFHPVISGEPVKVRYFQVYDRWGKMVWQARSNNPAEGWDGTYEGTPAEVGTYFYFINLETATGETFHQKGDVALVR